LTAEQVTVLVAEILVVSEIWQYWLPAHWLSVCWKYGRYELPLNPSNDVRDISCLTVNVFSNVKLI